MNKEERKQYMKEYYEQNKDAYKKRYLKRQLKPNYKENMSKYQKEYYSIHKDEHYKRNKSYHYRRKKKDLTYRLVFNERARISRMLRDLPKHSSSTELLGVDIQSYKQYLEDQFDKNMNWDNHGSYWEIDHIQPLSTFDLSKPEQQLKAFNYKNTRPLEKSLNRQRPKDGSDVDV